MSTSSPNEAGDAAPKPDPIGSAKDMAGSAGETLKRDAADVAAVAKDAAERKVEENKGLAAEMAQDIAAALHKAGDELGVRDRSPPAALAHTAANRLSSFAQHVSDKRPAELVDELRSFGRDNPLAFAGAAALAGFAIGRLLRGSIEPAFEREAEPTSGSPSEAATAATEALS